MSKAANGSRQTPRNTSEPAREPQVIGYVGENGNKTYDNFLEELSKLPTASELSKNTVQSADDNSQFPDVIFETPPENNDPLDCMGDPVTSAPAADTDTASDTNTREPQFVSSPDGQITEIIDETETGNEAENETVGDNADDTVADGQPIFSAPNYVKVPSTEQVRGEITEQSVPSENQPEQNVSGVTDNSAATPRPDRAEAQVTTQEQAERLNDQPVSGTDPNEQLTGRSFEEKAPTPVSEVSMAQGSRAEPSNFPEAVFSSYEDFIKQNPGKGTIVFRVYTGRQAVPLENAECVIYTTIDGSKYEIARLQTNSSGQTPVQELPAPDKELSQHSDNKIQAFALYDAKVTKKGFSQVILEDIPVFDGVQSVQRVFMIVDE